MLLRINRPSLHLRWQQLSDYREHTREMPHPQAAQIQGYSQEAKSQDFENIIINILLSLQFFHQQKLWKSFPSFLIGI